MYQHFQLSAAVRKAANAIAVSCHWREPSLHFKSSSSALVHADTSSIQGLKTFGNKVVFINIWEWPCERSGQILSLLQLCADESAQCFLPVLRGAYKMLVSLLVQKALSIQLKTVSPFMCFGLLFLEINLKCIFKKPQYICSYPLTANTPAELTLLTLKITKTRQIAL